MKNRINFFFVVLFIFCTGLLQCERAGAQPLSGPYPGTGLYSGQFTGNGGGLTGLNSLNIIGATNGLDFYLAPPPLGNDANNGSTRNTPFGTINNALLICSNFAPCNLHIMSGTNYCNGSAQVYVPSGVALIGDGWNSILMLTNYQAGVFNSQMYLQGSNSIANLTIISIQTNVVSITIGVGGGDPNSGITNVLFYHDNIVSYSSAIHFEHTSPFNGTFNNWVLDDCSILGNYGCIDFELGSTNWNFLVNNSTVKELNFTNIYLGGSVKPLHDISAQHKTANSYPQGIIVFQNDIISYGDTDLSTSNRPAYGFWGIDLLTNVITFNNCTLVPTLTNLVAGSGSYDVYAQANNNVNFSPSVIRNDGNIITMTNVTTATTNTGINFAIGGLFGGTTNGVAPSNATTPAAWFNFTTQAGAIYKVPLYQ